MSNRSHNACHLDQKISRFPMKLCFKLTCRDLAVRIPMSQTTIDYFIFENEYTLVMEHLGGEWMDVLSYVEEKEQLDIEEIRDIIKKIVDAMISLKQQGVVHGNLIADNVMYNTETNQVKLIDFGVASILPEWEEGQSDPLKSSDPPSPAPEYKAGDNELQTLDPGVENVYTWLRDGVLNGEADLDQRWLDGTVEHESMGTRYDNRALAARLADFLQVAYHAVSIHIMAQYHQDRLVEVG
ncbi:hypothetical protein BASA61_000123 [Batrachochytrium salamandrivorans]|nr:hypothetical protein BASA61_000123 [Batrachochytrium salamandrivorans]